MSPLDEALDAAGRAVTLGVTELACRLALDAASFQRAGECLRLAAGLRMSDETLRTLAESEGRWVVAAQEAEQLELDWHASDCRVAPRVGPAPSGEAGVTRLYLGCDGVLGPTVTHAEKQKRRAGALEKRRQKRPRPGPRRRPLPALHRGADDHYKEMQLVTFYDQDRAHRLVRVTRKDCRHAGKLMRQGMVGLRILGARERIALVDGAPWIAKQVRQRRPPFTALTLDFWHLSEHVHGARRQVFGETEAAGLAWAATALTTVKERGYAPFWEALTQLRCRQRALRKRQAVDDLLHYVSPRRDMINYPRHQARGWDIGSGPTESMGKALTRRVKGVGMRWDTPHAEAMMGLEALLQSRQWSNWWEYRHRQAA